MAYDFRKWVANERTRRRHCSTRWILIAGIVVVLGDAALTMLSPDVPNRLIAFHPVSFLPLALGAAMSPFAREAWITPRGLATYDEFEREALHRATMNAYRALLSLVMFGFGWLWLAAACGWPLPRSAQDWSAWGIATVLAGAALPLLFAEFQVPMPPEDDELDERS